MTVVNETVLAEIAARNKLRAEEAKKKMGTTYLLHTSNRTSRIVARGIPAYLLKSPSLSYLQAA